MTQGWNRTEFLCQVRSDRMVFEAELAKTGEYTITCQLK
jgi:hypothetical protein